MKNKKMTKALAVVLSCSLVGCGTNASNGTKEEVAVVSVEQKEASVNGIGNEAVKTTGINNGQSEEITTPEPVIVTAEDEESDLTPTQLNSLNMLNFMTVLTQQINESKGDQVFLQSARTSLYNDTNLNAVDTKTQAQITQLADTIDGYTMVDVKRKRLEYINEQNRAQALRQAIPNPVALLSAVQSGNMLKLAASALYMVVDSATSYSSALNQAEMEYLKEGWALDDEDVKNLQQSTTSQFNYMCNIVREYDLPDEYVVREEDIKSFVEWTENTNTVSKISWFEDNEATYGKFRPYWLELIKDYYNNGDYQKCLEAADQYEMISTRIIRKDVEYANVIPMIIIAAKETMSSEEYARTASEYCAIVRENTKDEDRSLRYFIAQIYMDLFSETGDTSYLNSAYDIVRYNVNILVKEQRKLNEEYLAPIAETKADKGATKREEKEVKQYNKFLKNERKIALPPVSEALYLNCDLMFALAEKIGIDEKEKNDIEAILHENGDSIFLTEALDRRFHYGTEEEEIQTDDIEIAFDGEEIEIPVICLSNRSTISLAVTSGGNTTTIEDWSVSEVDRKKKTDCSEFIATYTSSDAKKYKYKKGDKIVITVTPVVESPEKVFGFEYDVVGKKTAGVINTLAFERK